MTPRWILAAGCTLLLALGLVGTAGAAPTAQGSTFSHGTFSTLPAGQALGLSIEGVALIHRSASSTHVLILVRGLVPGTTYAAHLHSAPCSVNEAGGHYKNDPAGPAAPPNELWLSSTGDPTAGITAVRGGFALGFGSAPWVARPEAQAVVIHQIPPGGTTAGGPKIACADLG
jgi:hypothetical protein